MIDYKTNDPKGWCGDPKRGAAMGRAGIHGDDGFDGKLHVRRVRMSADGAYDSNGTYFGQGSPIYWVASDDGKIDLVLRAQNREVAQAKVLLRYPDAKFYR